MLILNADDFGFSQTVTDLVIAAYDERLITSTSAMVWMPDSARAAKLAGERGMPVGLHLNLTLPFRAADVPAQVRKLQAELTDVFGADSWNDDSRRSRQPDPRIKAAVAHQLEAFRAQFGEPTHLDGHHHLHVHPDVLVCLPREFPIRPVMRSIERLCARRSRQERRVRKLFRTPDACISLPQIHPWLGGAGLQTLSFSRQRILEVVVHAQLEEEWRAIHSAEWSGALEALQLGSYRDLP